jgi:hypothetical protein
MKIVYSDKHAQHDPQTFFVRGVKQRSSEQPERAERATLAESVHTPEYIDFLKTIARDWAKLPNASAEVVPTSIRAVKRHHHSSPVVTNRPVLLTLSPAGVAARNP